MHTDFDAMPAWSPSGTYLVFARSLISSNGLNEDLYFMKAAGSERPPDQLYVQGGNSQLAAAAMIREGRS